MCTIDILSSARLVDSLTKRLRTYSGQYLQPPSSLLEGLSPSAQVNRRP